jgi:hypothetical protein
MAYESMVPVATSAEIVPSIYKTILSDIAMDSAAASNVIFSVAFFDDAAFVAAFLLAAVVSGSGCRGELRVVVLRSKSLSVPEVLFRLEASYNARRAGSQSNSKAPFMLAVRDTASCPE